MSQSHDIDLTLNDSGGVTSVRADKNPLAGIEPGDTVTWHLSANAVGRELHVVFKEFQPLDGSVHRSVPKNGPFSALAASADRIVGTVGRAADQGRYIYEVFAGQTLVGWANPLPGGGNFGGLDVPQPPGG